MRKPRLSASKRKKRGLDDWSRGLLSECLWCRFAWIFWEVLQPHWHLRYMKVLLAASIAFNDWEHPEKSQILLIKLAPRGLESWLEHIRCGLLVQGWDLFLAVHKMILNIRSTVSLIPQKCVSKSGVCLFVSTFDPYFGFNTSLSKVACFRRDTIKNSQSCERPLMEELQKVQLRPTETTLRLKLGRDLPQKEFGGDQQTCKDENTKMGRLVKKLEDVSWAKISTVGWLHQTEILELRWL